MHHDEDGNVKELKPLSLSKPRSEGIIPEVWNDADFVFSKELTNLLSNVSASRSGATTVPILKQGYHAMCFSHPSISMVSMTSKAPVTSPGYIICTGTDMVQNEFRFIISQILETNYFPTARIGLTKTNNRWISEYQNCLALLKDQLYETACRPQVR